MSVSARDPVAIRQDCDFYRASTDAPTRTWMPACRHTNQDQSSFYRSKTAISNFRHGKAHIKILFLHIYCLPVIFYCLPVTFWQG
jgi:hypothetical protein